VFNNLYGNLFSDLSKTNHKILQKSKELAILHMEASKFANQISRLIKDYIHEVDPVNLFTRLASANEKQANYILKSGVTFQHYLGRETKYNYLESEAFK